MFVYLPTLDTLELRKRRKLFIFLVGNQRGYILLSLSLYTSLLHSIKRFGYRMGLKFYKNPLAVEQNSYTAKVLNAYIIYESDTWPKVSLINFALTNCLFLATNIVKNGDEEKREYGGYRIAFDRAGLLNFGNDFSKNTLIFGVANSLSSHVIIMITARITF